MKLLSKKHELIVKLSSWTTVATIVFAALFSSTGMGLPTGSFDIITSIADILGNFVTVLNIFLIICVAVILLILIIFNDDKNDMSKTTVDAMVKQHGIIETGINIKFRKKTFLFVTLPFWGILVASGWIFTVMVWVVVSAVLNTVMYKQRQYFNETYIKDIEGKVNEKAGSSRSTLVDSGLE